MLERAIGRRAILEILTNGSIGHERMLYGALNFLIVVIGRWRHDNIWVTSGT